ncbi:MULTISPECIES: DUF6119 family protein [unclassified Brevundimonas]|uniref:DUF6119 family protein n=1 Tax=unclassified Brevundimonas TaxID=2622653 RepID=UPI0007009E7D|nr:MULTISPECIES: DUF6119 family protein [unclassified Brevundimonas]KQY95061.1 hypothetical protein ASD25_17230 [Brevundimonas sp. Root1423]KRA28548.1 hypothetical protein ASD59_01570 [Brevundimonas sp. Root608]
MTEKTQNINLRLLREDVEPAGAIRAGVTLEPWAAFEGSQVATGALGGGYPGWTDFLDLPAATKNNLIQRSAYGLAFLKADARWFAVSFGMGHSKLDQTAFEQDFGLRVVLNAVDHTKLRSADLRTPDSNTLSRRSQTSRGSERTAFEIDPERDIVRGLLGEPKDKTFATRISGSDALTIRRKVKLDDLPSICSRALALHGLDDYKTEFGWIDQIKHVRDAKVLERLDGALASALTDALANNPSEVDDIGLAYPVIYDPDKTDWVRFRGFSSQSVFPDLEIVHYLSDLKAKSLSVYDKDFLSRHSVQECDEKGQVNGQAWPVKDCLVFETVLDGETFTLSGGRWYRIDADLAKEVAAYFANTDKVALPDAHAGDNEKRYNARVEASGGDLLSLDVKLVKPSDSSTSIEVCDFLGKDKRLIHIKDKSESSRLSHLFNQGLVSAIALKRDGPFRDRVRTKIAEQPGGADYVDLVPAAGTHLVPADYTVVFGVLVNGSPKKEPRLPFFSLITFRHAGRRIADELGYKVAFAWIKKPAAGVGKKAERQKKEP